MNNSNHCCKTHVPCENRTHNQCLGGACYIHLTKGTMELSYFTYPTVFCQCGVGTYLFEYFYIVMLVCFGCMGISYILSALTLIFTKMASFVSIVGYLFLFLSGSILSLPGYLNYTNPLSAGSHFYALWIRKTAGVKDFFMLLILCAVYFFVGKEIFAFVFRRSKQFKWTY